MELAFPDRVIFGGGKLASGHEICRHCFGKLVDINSIIRVKKLSLEDVKGILNVTKTVIDQTFTTPQQVVDVNPKPNTNTVSEPEPDVAKDKNQETVDIQIPTAPVIDPVTNRAEAKFSLIGITRASYPELWEVNEPQELSDEEQLIALLKGSYGTGNAALIATTEHLMVLIKKFFGGESTELYKLSWIVSINSISVGTLSDLTFNTSSNTVMLKDVDTKRAVAFCETVKPLLSA